jgi:hypothetical protein
LTKNLAGGSNDNSLPPCGEPAWPARAGES